MKRLYRVISRFSILFFISFLATLTIFSHFPAQSRGEPTVSVKTIYYPIQGTTSAQLREQMDRLGPPDPKTGKRFSAYARWNVNWRYWTFKPDNNSLCRLTRLEVTTDVTITLPRWIPPAKVSRSLVQQWNKFMSALVLHENGHKKHGVLASQEIGQLSWDRFARSNCDEVGQLFNQTANTIIQTYSQADVEYDRATKHGITQGAVFP